MEESGRKVGLAVRLMRSDSDRSSSECQWGESPVRGCIYMPEVRKEI